LEKPCYAGLFAASVASALLCPAIEAELISQATEAGVVDVIANEAADRHRNAEDVHIEPAVEKIPRWPAVGTRQRHLHARRHRGRSNDRSALARIMVPLSRECRSELVKHSVPSLSSIYRVAAGKA
jgi:hypothetical protein